MGAGLLCRVIGEHLAEAVDPAPAGPAAKAVTGLRMNVALDHAWDQTMTCRIAAISSAGSTRSCSSH